jgi:hypothetical protein
MCFDSFGLGLQPKYRLLAAGSPHPLWVKFASRSSLAQLIALPAEIESWFPVHDHVVPPDKAKTP